MPVRQSVRHCIGVGVCNCFRFSFSFNSSVSVMWIFSAINCLKYVAINYTERGSTHKFVVKYTKINITAFSLWSFDISLVSLSQYHPRPTAEWRVGSGFEFRIRFRFESSKISLTRIVKMGSSSSPLRLLLKYVNFPNAFLLFYCCRCCSCSLQRVELISFAVPTWF